MSTNAFDNLHHQLSFAPSINTYYLISHRRQVAPGKNIPLYKIPPPVITLVLAFYKAGLPQKAALSRQTLCS